MVNENSGATFIDEKEQTWDYLSSLIANNNNEKCLPLLGLLYSNKKKTSHQKYFIDQQNFNGC